MLDDALVLHVQDPPRQDRVPVGHDVHIRTVVAPDVLEAVGELLSRGEELLEVAEGAGERLAAGIDDPRIRQDEVDQADVAEVVRHLVDEVRLIGAVHARVRDKPYFIDKMPNNFRHIGLIHLILPNARIIDARREPLACSFSNFKQLFASGQEFTYSLEDIGRYYRAYVDVMAHWDTVLPGGILHVQHESVVEDLEGNVRRLLDFLGLPFEAACIEFYRTDRSVRTASSEQVRQPIYKEGIDQWRSFEPWLGPLKSALGDLLPS